MKKSPPTTTTQMRAYAAEKFSLGKRLLDDFHDIFGQVLRNEELERFATKAKERQKQMDSITRRLEALTTQTPKSEDFVELRKTIDQIINSLKRITNASADYYRIHGETDRRAIQAEVKKCTRLHELFKTKWQTQVANAMRAQDYTKAAQILRAIPKFSVYPHIHDVNGYRGTYREFEDLSQKYQEIVSWIDENTDRLPPEFVLREKISELEQATQGWHAKLLKVSAKYLQKAETSGAKLAVWSQYEFESKQDGLLEQINEIHRELKESAMHLRFARVDLTEMTNRKKKTRE